MTKVNVPSRKAVRELICYQRAGEESVSDCPMRAEKFTMQQSQQAALQLPSCSHDFLRMLRCLCSPRSDQTGCVHCVLPASGKVITGPSQLLPSSYFGIFCHPCGTKSGCKGQMPSLACGHGENWALPLNLHVFT